MKKRKSERRYKMIILVGILIVLAISLIEGFSIIFTRTVFHLVEDFTIDLLEHVYIAGWILVIYGLYKLYRRW